MKLLQLLVSVAAMAVAGVASAGLTTIGFNEVPIKPLSTVNLDLRGFRFSPPCHIDTRYDTGYAEGIAIGWDASGCDGPLHNSNYLGAGIQGYSGPGNQMLYLDHAGYQFDLVSFVALGFDYQSGPTVISSKGGRVFFPLTTGVRQEYLFSGDEWKGVDWILLQNGGGGPNWYMDSITLNSVPEPTALGLLGVAGLAALVAGRRRDGSQPG